MADDFLDATSDQVYKALLSSCLRPAPSTADDLDPCANGLGKCYYGNELCPEALKIQN